MAKRHKACIGVAVERDGAPDLEGPACSTHPVQAGPSRSQKVQVPNIWDFWLHRPYLHASGQNDGNVFPRSGPCCVSDGGPTDLENARHI